MELWPGPFSLTHLAFFAQCLGQERHSRDYLQLQGFGHHLALSRQVAHLLEQIAERLHRCESVMEWELVNQFDLRQFTPWVYYKILCTEKNILEFENWKSLFNVTTIAQIIIQLVKKYDNNKIYRNIHVTKNFLYFKKEVFLNKINITIFINCFK